VAPDVIEKTGHGGSEAGSWIDAGRGVSEVGRQGEQTPEQAGQAEQNPEKAPCRLFRTSGTACWSARGSLSNIGGSGEWSISGIPVKCAPLALASDSAQGAGSATDKQEGHYAGTNNSLERLFYGVCDPCERRGINGLRVEPG